MPLFENGKWGEDRWLKLDDDAALPAAGAVIVSLKRLQENWESLKAFRGSLGVEVANNCAPEMLAAYLARLELIVLPFPSFTDGRAYSLALQLREAGYKNDLRASGNVLPDQLPLMQQVGFSSFAINDRFSISALEKALQKAPVNRIWRRLDHP